jgi:hypothetical protein
VAAAPRRPWLLIAGLAALGLLAAVWLVLRGNAESGLQAPQSAASEAASAPLAVATSSEPAPALASGESFVEPLPAASAPAVPRSLSAESPPTARSTPASAPARTSARAEPRGDQRAEPRRPATSVIVAQEPAPPPLQQPAAQASLPRAVVVQEAPGAADPKAACGSRVFIALTMCVDRKCREPAHAQHPECVRLREIREQRERN